MSAESKRAFCREWYVRGECPGCGAPLAKVAGQGKRHWKSGQTLAAAGGPRVTGPGEVIDSVPGISPLDRRLCSWTADDLTSLVLIATDFGRCANDSGAPTASPPESFAERPMSSVHNSRREPSGAEGGRSFSGRWR